MTQASRNFRRINGTLEAYDAAGKEGLEMGKDDDWEKAAREHIDRIVRRYPDRQNWVPSARWLATALDEIDKLRDPAPDPMPTPASPHETGEDAFSRALLDAVEGEKDMRLSGRDDRSDEHSTWLPAAREAVCKAICCPEGCVRPDDCWSGNIKEPGAGRRKKQSDAVLAAILTIKQESPADSRDGVEEINGNG